MVAGARQSFILLQGLNRVMPWAIMMGMSKKFHPWVAVALSFTLLAILAGCSKPVPLGAQGPDKDGYYTTGSGLKYKIVQPGSGEIATAGETVQVAYKGSLTDGDVFDASPAGKPFSFSLGMGQVIKGWDEGIEGMKVGEKRILVIPPELGYGQQGANGKIPPDATLVFETELIGVK